MNNGYIKIHRKLLDNPAVMKDADHLAVWMWLLLNVTHKARKVDFSGRIIELKSGQVTCGRQQIAKNLSLNESKVERILKLFKSEQQIEQQTSNKCRLITINNWNGYQQNEQQNEQQVNNKRTTSEQQMNTKQECKNIKNVNISTKVDTEQVQTHGREDITKLLEFLKTTFGLSDFREPRKKQRQMGKHILSLVDKHGKEKFRAALTNIAKDDFKSKNCNSVVYLYRELKGFPYDKPLLQPQTKSRLAIIS